MIQIERGVPVPPKRVGQIAKYPFHEMEPGDSFAVDVGTDDPRRVVNRVNTAAQAWKRRHNPGAKFRLEAKGGVVRIWLVNL